MSVIRPLRLKFRACAAALLMLTVAPVAASAADVRMDIGHRALLVFSATAGEANRGTLLAQGPEFDRTVTITEEGAALRAGDGCVQLDPQRVSCAGVDQVYIDLEDGDDTLTFAGDPNGLRVIGFAGAGADTIQGCDSCRGFFQGNSGHDVLSGGGALHLYGDSGNDTIRGEGRGQALTGDAGHDTITGGAGRNHILPGPGDDSVDGGLGRDELSYLGSSSVTVDLGRRIAWGVGRDAILGIEEVTGTNARDVLIGDAAENLISGFGGADVIRGGPGPDLLVGDFEGAGAVGGADTIYGGAGNDRIAGQVGDDFLYGGAGRDFIGGGHGDDRLRSADGERDRVFGSRGWDRARIDRGLDVISAVECVNGRNMTAARVCRVQLAG